MFETDELRLLWRFYAAAFLFMAFFIFMPYWVIFYKGFLSFTQLSILMAIMFITPLFFEVPTGIIADLYGRKFSTLLGYFTQAILFVILTYTTNYTMLVILFLLFGVTSTLFSGAENAWVVDWLIKEKRKSLQAVYFRKRSVIMNVAQLTAAGVGILVVKYFSMAYIWAVSGLGLFLGALILLPAGEHFKPKRTRVSEIFRELVKGTQEAVRYTIKKKALARFTLYLTLLYGASAFAMMSWDVELLSLGFPVHLFALNLVLGSILGIIISLYYHRLVKVLGHLNSLYLGGAIIVVFYVVAYFTHSAMPFFFLLGLQYAMWNSFYYPISFDYLHNVYVSRMRATLESVTNLISMGGMGVFLVVGGFLNDIYGPRIMILVAGMLLAIVVTVFFASEK